MANFLNVYNFINDYLNRYETLPPPDVIKKMAYEGVAPEFRERGISREAAVSAKESEARTQVAAQEAQTQRERVELASDIAEQNQKNQGMYNAALGMDLAGKGYKAGSIIYDALTPSPATPSPFDAAAVPSATALPATSLYADVGVTPYLSTQAAPMMTTGMEGAVPAAFDMTAVPSAVAGATPMAGATTTGAEMAALETVGAASAINPVVSLFGAAVFAGLLSLFARRNA